MIRKPVSGIALLLLLMGMLALALNAKPVKASGTIYIKADGSIDPPTATISTVDNVTYILTGNIASDADGIVVERNNILVEGAGYTVLGTVSGRGIHLSGRSNVSIQNTNFKNFYSGIELEFCSNNSISGNNITNDVGGIVLEFCSNNSISGNNITSNGSVGITLYTNSNYNSISGNTITNNGVGIVLYELTRACINNTVCHNNFIGNTVQANDVTPQANFWGNGCEGNYWSNYVGTDLDNDGVGDTYLPWEGVDNYPLMNIYWSPCDINHDLKVDMKDVSRAARAFGTVPGDTSWNPHVDITGPTPSVPDGKIDMRDVSLAAKHFGEHYP